MSIITKIKSFFNNPQLYQRQMFNTFGAGSINPTWSSLKAYEFYSQVPELRSIIDAQASMFTKIKIRYVGKDGKDINSDFLELLKNPNPYQDGKEFINSLYKIYNLNGIVFIYTDFNGLKGLSAATQIYCFSPADLTLQLKSDTSKPKRWTDLYSSIKAKMPYSGIQVDLDLNNLTFFAESGISISDFANGANKITAASFPLDNLRKIYESENVIISNRGAAGVFSPETQHDKEYNIPINLSKTDQEDFNKRIGDGFGSLINQVRYLLSPIAVKFINLLRTPSELGLEESRKRNKITLCDLWQHSILLLNEMEGATFSNVKTVKAAVYENKIIPDMEKFIAFLNSNYNKERGLLTFDTSDIESLREDDKLQAETSQIKTNIIISLNTAVYEGKMKKETAVNILITHGYEADKAVLLINDKINNNGNNNQI